MANPARIYLTGFMGSGKSTVGPILANVLGYDFVDLDAEIEAREGSIPSIFGERGEEAFRNIESKVLREVSRRSGVVVALGGGALLSSENLALVLSSGTLVYLKIPVPVLRERLLKSQRRPLLRDASGAQLGREALTQRIEQMVRDRSPIYERAHITVPVERVALGRTVDEVAAAVRRYARSSSSSSSTSSGGSKRRNDCR